jgi:hypothetical protein
LSEQAIGAVSYFEELFSRGLALGQHDGVQTCPIAVLGGDECLRLRLSTVTFDGGNSKKSARRNKDVRRLNELMDERLRQTTERIDELVRLLREVSVNVHDRDEERHGAKAAIVPTCHTRHACVSDEDVKDPFRLCDACVDFTGKAQPGCTIEPAEYAFPYAPASFCSQTRGFKLWCQESDRVVRQPVGVDSRSHSKKQSRWKLASDTSIELIKVPGVPQIKVKAVEAIATPNGDIFDRRVHAEYDVLIQDVNMELASAHELLTDHFSVYDGCVVVIRATVIGSLKCTCTNTNVAAKSRVVVAQPILQQGACFSFHLKDPGVLLLTDAHTQASRDLLLSTIVDGINTAIRRVERILSTQSNHSMKINGACTSRASRPQKKQKTVSLD